MTRLLAWAKHMAKALAPWAAAAEVEVIARLAGGQIMDRKALGLVALSSYQVWRTSNGRKPRSLPRTQGVRSPDQEVSPSPPTPLTGTTLPTAPRTGTLLSTHLPAP